MTAKMYWMLKTLKSLVWTKNALRLRSTDAVGSKQEAYTLGAEKLLEFEGMSGRDLNADLVPIRSYVIGRDKTHLKDGGYVTVQERLNHQGQLEYVAKVHFDVHYQERDSN
jgi:hypothetical protein